ncbi:hypothetical protein EVAR_94231_1 [Eumeta japonica]|uniref:PiggyBac transposable element-derived protein domain-containing protein n=1 Tax=Eumeta variegata TaxID=151549 RepID=A0A4C1UP45_EUMVA|nr:hypothetical protein EVAR_94231_1 [Eumeta japonica]
MSRRLTENQIAQIIHDFSDSESEGIEDTAQENILEEVEDTSSNSFTVKPVQMEQNSTTSRTRQHNIIEERTGLKGPALSKNEMSPVETWELLLTDDIIQLIVQYTNQS